MAETPSITVESLLSESDWLRALAHQLVRDKDRAEDLFQETVLASLRDRDAVRGPMRPWLSRVARNLAFKSHRTDARRRRREAQVAQSEASSESHVDAKERFHMHRTVVDAVQELEEPYHTPVLLRFFEDLPPREIAKRLDVPVETVKTRIKRGMQLLRGKLDAEFGDRQTWVAAILPALEFGGKQAATATATTATTGAGGLAIFSLVPSQVLLPAAALLLLGVLGYAIFGGFGERPNDAETAVAAEGSGMAAADGRESVPGQERSQQQPERRAVEESSAVEGETILIKLVEKATGRPVPNLDVRFVDQSDFTPERDELMRADQGRVMKGELSAVTFYHRYSRSVRADENGEARVPKPKRGMVAVMVIEGALEGKLTLRKEAKATERKLELHPKVELDIEAVDEAGEPLAREPVAWITNPPRFTALTAADGKARLRLWMAFEEVRTRKGHVGFAGPVGGRVPVDLDRLPSGPIRLVMPQTGSMVVTPVDERGKAISTDGFVTLHGPASGPKAKTPKGMPPAFAARMRALRGMRGGRGGNVGPQVATAPLQNGRAVFPRVGLGRRFVVRVQVTDRSDPLQAEARGPVSAGQETVVEVRAAARERVVAFRIVDGSGRTKKNTRFQTSLHSTMGGGSSRFGSSIQSDRDGVVRITLKDAWSPKGRRTLDVSVTKNRWSSDQDPDATARVDLSRPFQPGVTRLPDLKLGSLPVLVAGVVIDGAGRPVEDARVTVASLTERPGGRPWAERLHGVEEFRTRKDGVFTLRGRYDGENVRVTAWKPGRFLAAPVDVRPGTKNLKVKLPKAGGLSGSFAKGLFARGLGFELVPAQEGVTKMLASASDTDQSFTVNDLAPGEWRFVVKLSGFDGPVFDIPVTIVPGKMVRPSMLQGIDLRDRVKLIRVTLRDPAGKPVRGQSVQWVIGNRGSSASTDAKGVATLVTPHEDVDVVADIEGYRIVVREEIASDLTIALRPAISVLVQISGALPPGREVQLGLRSVQRRRFGAWTKTVRIGPEGTARLQIRQPGEYELRHVFQVSRRVTTGTRTKIFAPGNITVADTEKPQRFAVKIDPEKLTKSLEELATWQRRQDEAQRRR